MVTGDLPAILPVFPLDGAVLFPQGRLPLNIFEPRYLTMIEDCLRTPDRLIGMIQPRKATHDNPSELRAVGCAGRLVSFVETDDGRYQILLRGISRFHLVEVEDSFSPYLKAEVDWSGYTKDMPSENRDRVAIDAELRDVIKRYADTQNLSIDIDALARTDAAFLINTVSMIAPFSSDEKQMLLEAKTLSDRRAALMTILEFAMRPNADRTLQ